MMTVPVDSEPQWSEPTPDNPGKASLPSPRNFLWARCTLLFLQTLAHEQNADNNSHKIKLITVFFTISQLSTLCNYPKQMTAEHLKRNTQKKCYRLETSG